MTGMRDDRGDSPPDNDGREREDADDTRIRTVVSCPRRGRIVTMGFPGLVVGIDGQAHVLPEPLAATLDRATRLRVSILLVLTEAPELPADAHRLLRVMARAHGIRDLRLPVPDYGVPGPRFLKAWRTLSPELHRRLDEGGAIGMTCSHGAGRSGTIAAMLLIERGLNAAQAIARVRGAFAESIESPAQIDWLRTLDKPD